MHSNLYHWRRHIGLVNCNFLKDVQFCLICTKVLYVCSVSENVQIFFVFIFSNFCCLLCRPYTFPTWYSGRCGLVVSVSGSGAEGPGFESWPGYGVFSLEKTLTTNFVLVGLVSVTVTRCCWGMVPASVHFGKHYLSRGQGKNTKI